MRVLITGASSGIGAALARAMAARGDEVWLAARREERLRALAAQIASTGGKAHVVVLDVGDARALGPRLADLDAQAGGFDVVVANAGIGGKGATASGLTFDDARSVLDINFTGAIATLLGAMHPMLARGRGHLVAVSSLVAELALPVAPDYGAAKAGLSYFVEAMRHDVKRRGIAVTLVHPGFVKSEITDRNDFPMPFIISDDDAAKIIVRGIDRRAARVRFPLAYRVAFFVAKLLPAGLVAALATRTAHSGPEGMKRK